MTKPHLLVVCAAIIDVDGRVLIQQRPAHKIFPGKWEFPGGKVHKDEIPTTALRRELEEELAITTIEKAFFPISFVTGEYTDFDYHVINMMYGCRNWTGVPQALEGQQNFAWVKPPRLNDYDLLDKNRELVPVLSQLI